MKKKQDSRVAQFKKTITIQEETFILDALITMRYGIKNTTIDKTANMSVFPSHYSRLH